MPVAWHLGNFALWELAEMGDLRRGGGGDGFKPGGGEFAALELGIAHAPGKEGDHGEKSEGFNQGRKGLHGGSMRRFGSL